MRRSAILVVLGAVLLAVPVASSRPAATYAVERVIDGDTIVLSNDTHVRLVQIDSPELSGSECYAVAARSALTRLLPASTRVGLEFDSRLDRTDRYGRSLAYVRKGQENVNLTLVARGAGGAGGEARTVEGVPRHGARPAARSGHRRRRELRLGLGARLRRVLSRH